MREVIRQKLIQGTSDGALDYTRRNIRLPQVRNKAHAIVGMRRSGKTTFLYQCRADLIREGRPPAALVYFSFDDERLADLDAQRLHWILEEYYTLHPAFRDTERVVFFFDEIQLVPGWEQFARRILDSEKVQLFVSGSSAHMLSREVATSFRGRAMETLVYPFSFREFLRHRDAEPDGAVLRLTKAQRSVLEHAFEEYLHTGGFPEAQGTTETDRLVLLQGYVDTVVLRDVIERHTIRNVTALREMSRQLLANAASPFSVNRFYNDLKSRGVPASKDLLHALLAHLEDTFLIRLVPIHTTSERVRQTNPRKVYPVDQGLIHAFDRSGRPNIGHSLETAVLIEIERRGYGRAYLHTHDGFEVDFIVTPPVGGPILIQVCADLSDKKTRGREFRALVAACAEIPDAAALVLTLTSTGISEARREAPQDIQILPAWEWLLDTETAD